MTKNEFVLLQKRAAACDPDALFDLGLCYRDGIKDTRGRQLIAMDVGKARHCFREASRHGNAGAMMALADMLVSSKDVRCRQEGIRLYRKAFSKKVTIAGYNLAVTYQALGRPRLAMEWFRKVVAAGDRSALLPIAQAELFGSGVRKNLKSALKNFRHVAVGGESITQFDSDIAALILALIYMSGWLVPRNPMIARKWLRLSAGRGSAAAKGLLCDIGEAYVSEQPPKPI